MVYHLIKILVVRQCLPISAQSDATMPSVSHDVIGHTRLHGGDTGYFRLVFFWLFTIYSPFSFRIQQSVAVFVKYSDLPQ